MAQLLKRSVLIITYLNTLTMTLYSILTRWTLMTLSMPPISWKYLIDIRRRPMYLLSKEGIFQLMFNFGVSKCFRALLGKFPLQIFSNKFLCYAFIYYDHGA